jgi:hypothetical protein
LRPALAVLLLLPAGLAQAEPPRYRGVGSAAAAAQLAEVFSQVGDQIYEECIFDLSPEQIEVQNALIQAYIEKGATGLAARKLAVRQIQPPKLSHRCEQLRSTGQQPPSSPWETAVEEEAPQLIAPPKLAEPPRSAEELQIAAVPPPVRKPKPTFKRLPATVALKDKKMLPQWDCAPNVDYVAVRLQHGFTRKLTGGEICNRYEDVVRPVPAAAHTFRLGYVIASGRLFVESDDATVAGRTIAWAISGRDVCRNNPDPDCLATKGMGSLPPGEYSFSSDKDRRISWGPKTKRNVAGIYLKKLWNQERFSPRQLAGIRKRGNIAIHVRLKGEMSEACIGLEPKGWAYVAGLVKEGRATGVNVYLEEPHPQIAEAPPLVQGSSFSLTSLFN